jgi:hypothetical protein
MDLSNYTLGTLHRHEEFVFCSGRTISGRIHFSSCCWRDFSEFIWIAEYVGPVFHY